MKPRTEDLRYARAGNMFSSGINGGFKIGHRIQADGRLEGRHGRPGLEAHVATLVEWLGVRLS